MNFRNLFNLNKVEKLEAQVDTNLKRVEQLEEQLSKYESIELECRVLRLYVEDDEAILELLEAAKAKESEATKAKEWDVDNERYKILYGLQLKSAYNQSYRARQQADLSGLSKQAYLSGLSSGFSCFSFL